MNQTNTGTVSVATPDKLLKDGVSEVHMGFLEHVDTILKLLQLNQQTRESISA